MKGTEGKENRNKNKNKKTKSKIAKIERRIKIREDHRFLPLSALLLYLQP